MFGGRVDISKDIWREIIGEIISDELTTKLEKI